MFFGMWRCTISSSVKLYLGLFAAGLLLVGLAGVLQRAPGYMDADYYYATAQGLAEGQGFWQNFLWNYLDQPAALPQPSHTYWMPLVSLLAAAGLKLGGGWWTARLPLWLAVAAVPPLAAWMAGRLGGLSGQKLLAGAFALVPGFYLAYLPTTDAFGLTMLLGALAAVVGCGEGRFRARLLVYGLLAGLLHLTRADGILWLGGGLLLAAWRGKLWKGGFRETALLAGLCIGGYLLPMSGWLGRNWFEWGGLFPPGNSRTLWLTQYEDTFVYPAGMITAERWLAQGWGAHLAAIWRALTTNLQTLLAVQGQVALLPFAVVGLWSRRREPLVRFSLFMALLTLGLMTVVFPYAGTNGSYFHSGAAFQVLIWAAAALGIQPVAQGYARLRKLETEKRIERFAGGMLIGVLALMSVGLYFSRLAGDAELGNGWNDSAATYTLIETELVRLGAQPGDRVMVNNPPGYYLAGGRASVVIPYGDEQMLRAAARQYQVKYLVLEAANAGHLTELYAEPADRAGLDYLATIGTALIYEFKD